MLDELVNLLKDDRQVVLNIFEHLQLVEENFMPVNNKELGYEAMLERVKELKAEGWKVFDYHYSNPAVGLTINMYRAKKQPESIAMTAEHVHIANAQGSTFNF